MVTMVNRFLKYSIPILLSINLACGSKPTKPEDSEPRGEITTVNVDNIIGARIETRYFVVNIPPNSLREDAQVTLEATNNDRDISSNTTLNGKVLELKISSALEDSIKVSFKQSSNKDNLVGDSKVVVSQEQNRFKLHRFNIENNNLTISYLNQDNHDLETKIWINSYVSPEPSVDLRGNEVDEDKIYTLLVHGLGSNPGAFSDERYSDKSLIEILDESLGNVITYTYPSDKLPSENANSLRYILRNLGIKKLNIVAHSMGVIVARDFVRNNDNSIRTLKMAQLGGPNNGFETIEPTQVLLETLINESDPEKISMFYPYNAIGAQSLVKGSEYLRNLNTTLPRILSTDYYIFAGNCECGVLSDFLPGLDDGVVTLESANMAHEDFPAHEDVRSLVSSIFPFSHSELRQRPSIFNEIKEFLKLEEGSIMEEWDIRGLVQGPTFEGLRGIAFLNGATYLIDWQGFRNQNNEHIQLDSNLYKADLVERQVLESHRLDNVKLARGLTTDGANLWTSAFYSGSIRDHLLKINPLNGEVMFSRLAPESELGRNGQIQGVSLDNNYLWCSSWRTNRVYKLNPLSLDQLGYIQLSLGQSWLTDIASSGRYIFAVEHTGGYDRILKIRAQEGNVVNSFNGSSSGVQALTFKSSSLYYLESSKVSRVFVNTN